MLHTNILIFIVIELCSTPRHYPSRRAAMIGMIIIMAIYLGWLFCIKANTDYWVYPVLAKLNWTLRILFLTFTALVPVAFYFVGEFFNTLRWKKEARSAH